MAILTTAPEGALVLDLGGARAARAEVRAAAGLGNPFLKLAVGFVEIRAEVSVSAILDLQAEKIEVGLAGLLVDPADIAALLADGLSEQDLRAIIEFITGTTSGE
jgi:hypothetical protein